MRQQPLDHRIVILQSIAILTFNADRKADTIPHPLYQFARGRIHVSLEITRYAHRGGGGNDTLRGYSDMGLGQKGSLCRIYEDINESSLDRECRGSRPRDLGKVIRHVINSRWCIAFSASGFVISSFASLPFSMNQAVINIMATSPNRTKASILLGVASNETNIPSSTFRRIVVTDGIVDDEEISQL